MSKSKQTLSEAPVRTSGYKPLRNQVARWKVGCQAFVMRSNRSLARRAAEGGGVETSSIRRSSALTVPLFSAAIAKSSRRVRTALSAWLCGLSAGFGLSDPHVRRLLRFAYLAPDIIEAIVEGHQPRSLTVKLLLLAWCDQCAAFGFSH
jgi:hypothetical protein